MEPCTPSTAARHDTKVEGVWQRFATAWATSVQDWRSCHEKDPGRGGRWGLLGDAAQVGVPAVTDQKATNFGSAVNFCVYVRKFGPGRRKGAGQVRWELFRYYGKAGMIRWLSFAHKALRQAGAALRQKTARKDRIC